MRIHWEDSIIGKINVASGKHYNDITAETNVSISQESSVTASFELTRASNANDLWLTLQTKDGKPASLPVGTELTLLDASSDGFYSYVVTGTEEEDKIPLTAFKKMWSEPLFTGTIDSQTTLTFILAFDHLNGLTTGDYSLRLQSNAVADPNGADFTVNNSSATVQLEGGSGFQEEKSKYPLTLTISPGSDSRLTYGAAAVITLDDHAEYPAGTVFTYEGKNYTPVNDRVYLVLGRKNDTATTYDIVMDTTESTGLAPGTHSLTANIFSVGLNSGSAVINNHGTVTYEVTAIPKYGLKVVLDSSGSRAVEPNTTMDFTVNYSIQNTDTDSMVIGVTAYRKSDGKYLSTPETGWQVSGNKPLKGNQEGTQNILVTVPDTSPGTYRLEFTLGDKKTFYNIIVKPSINDQTAGTT